MDREAYMALGEDGVVHGYRSLDDGAPARTALCGYLSKVRAPRDESPVCPKCLPLVAQELGIEDVEEFVAECEEESN